MRVELFTLGIASLALVWLGPLPGLAPGAFSAHMIMHMGVVALAAPLIALGVAGGRYIRCVGRRGCSRRFRRRSWS